MAFRFEMVSAVIEMGAAVGGDPLRCSGKLPVGRSRQAAAGGYGLRNFCRNWHCGDGDRRNGIFWREYEHWARLFPGTDCPRAHWSPVFLGRDRVTKKPVARVAIYAGLMSRRFAAVSPSIAARSASLKPAVFRIWSTEVVVQGNG